MEEARQDGLARPRGLASRRGVAPLKRKVYRFEAALRHGRRRRVPPSGERGSISINTWSSSSRNEVLKVVAMTTRDPHLSFRKPGRAGDQEF